MALPMQDIILRKSKISSIKTLSGDWHSISYQRGKTLARHRDILVNGESAPCPFCRLCEETASHLLLTCFVEDRIWKWCYSWIWEASFRQKSRQTNRRFSSDEA
ncbi:hypothetical protein AAZV13_04G115532 [Glycine max]